MELNTKLGSREKQTETAIRLSGTIRLFQNQDSIKTLLIADRISAAGIGAGRGNVARQILPNGVVQVCFVLNAI